MGFISAAMGIIALVGASSVAKDAKSAAKEQAATDFRVTQEKIYQSKLEERVMAGGTRAAAAGSGVKADTGSPLTILAEQARTFARDRQFVSDVGAENAKLTLQRGQNVADAARYSGAASALSAFGRSATATKKYGGFLKFG